MNAGADSSVVKYGRDLKNPATPFSAKQVPTVELFALLIVPKVQKELVFTVREA